MALTAEEEKELAALESKSLTPDEEAELAALEARSAEQPKSMKQKILEKAHLIPRALDYAGGAFRTGVAAAIDPFTEKELVKENEFIKALKGEADFPTSADVLERAGAEKWGSLSGALPEMFDKPGQQTWRPDIGGLLDFTGRGTAGAMADMALDPLNWISFGLVGAGKKAAKTAAKEATEATVERMSKEAAQGSVKFKMPTQLTEAEQAAQAALPGGKKVAGALPAPEKDLMRAPIEGAPATPGGKPPAKVRPEVTVEGEPIKRSPKEAIIEAAKLARDNPLAALGAVAGGAARAAKAIPVAAAKFPSAITDMAGEGLYRAGLKPVVGQGERFGKDVTDTYFRHGFSSLEHLGPKVQDAANRLKKETDELLTVFDKGGVAVPRKEIFDPMSDELGQLVADEVITHKEALGVINDVMERFGRNTADVPLSQLTKWKRATRKGLPGNAWNEMRVTTPDAAKQLQKNLSNTMQKLIEEKAIAHNAKKGAALAEKNKDWGTFLTTMEKAHQWGDRGVSLLSPLDMLILSGEIPAYASGHSGSGAGMYGLKKTLEVLAHPKFKTKAGWHLKAVGAGKHAAPITDAAVRKAITGKLRKDEEEKK